MAGARSGSGFHRVVVMAACVALGGCGGSRGAGARSAAEEEAAARARSAGEHEMVVDGHALAYHVRGQGPPCIVHPGGPGVEWSYLRMPEVERRMTLIYVEPVGTGDSGRLATANDYSYARYAADVEALRAHLGLERTCLLGHSHGGLVAQTYAVAHPDRLNALVLYGTAAALDEAWRADMRANLERYAQQPWYAEARAGFDLFWEATSDDEATRALRAELPLYFANWDALGAEVRGGLESLRAWAGPARARGPRFDVTGTIGAVGVPTVVITGRYDFIMSAVTAERLHGVIPGSRLVILERSGHMGHIEEPEAFAAALASVADGLEAAR